MNHFLKNYYHKIISPKQPIKLNQFPGTQFEVNNWIISDFIVNTLVPIVGTKPFPLNELQLIVSSVIFFKPEVIFDWGTHIGKSARIFYESKKYFNLNPHIYSIDLPDNVDHPEHPHSDRGLLVRKFCNVKLIQGDGVTQALKIYKKYNFKNALFLLDGDHKYSSVIRELTLINENVINPAILVHDTFYQSAESGYNIGPYKACTEFLKNHKQYSKISTTTGLPGMTLLYKYDNR